jgi:signal transduction histidine kinase
MLRFRKKIVLVSIFLTPLFLLPWPFAPVAYLLVQQCLLYYLMRPIGQIMGAIRSSAPSHIAIESIQDPELYAFGSAINAMSEKIESQVEHLTWQREETEAILASLKEGIIATDTSARITFFNETASQMLGSPLAICQTLQALGSELSHKCHELILEALQTSQAITYTQTLRFPRRCYLDLTATPLTHQKGALLVLQDRTSDYQIVELGKDFIANASHELRTPITIIRGFAETLQDVPNLSSQMLQEITEKIVRTCTRLDKLVRSLLTLSDIEHFTSDRLKATDLVLLAENCRHHLLAAHPAVKVEWRSDIDTAPIAADPDLLELAILNILENGVRYSAQSAHIVMTLSRTSGKTELQIQDHGIGIAAHDLPHIFDRFYTVDKARSRKSGGAGLGLSIVKTIIEKHKGKVSAASELGQGSTFTIELVS